MTSEGRVCLRLADVKRYGVSYFVHHLHLSFSVTYSFHSNIIEICCIRFNGDCSDFAERSESAAETINSATSAPGDHSASVASDHAQTGALKRLALVHIHVLLVDDM